MLLCPDDVINDASARDTSLIYLGWHEAERWSVKDLTGLGIRFLGPARMSADYKELCVPVYVQRLVVDNVYCNNRRSVAPDSISSLCILL